MLDLELTKSYMQDCEWSYLTQFKLFQAHLVHVVNLKAILIFLHCPRYSNVRNTYLSGYVHTHSVQELLYGMVTATDEDDETMFCHVQEFIVKFL